MWEIKGNVIENVKKHTDRHSPFEYVEIGWKLSKLRNVYFVGILSFVMAVACG